MKTELKHLRLLHENAPGHKACTVAEIWNRRWLTHPNPPPPTHSPELAPCDYFLFHI